MNDKGDTHNIIDDMLEAISAPYVIESAKKLADCTEQMRTFGNWLARPDDCRDVLARIDEICEGRGIPAIINLILINIMHQECDDVEGAKIVIRSGSRSKAFLRAYAMSFGLSDDDCQFLVSTLLMVGASAARAIDQEKKLAAL